MVHRLDAARRRVVVVHGTDGDHRRVVARRTDRPVDLLAARRQAKIAGRHHDRDAGCRRAARSGAQRIGLPGLRRRRRQAEVHHADVVLLRVVDNPLDAIDRLADRAGAVAVEHLDVIDVCVRRDAGRIGRA